CENPQAALLFHWRDLSRQIRVHGSVERLSIEQAEAYFQSRPEDSRFSAASSCQSSSVTGRNELQDEVQRLRKLYPEGQVPRPDAWTGYRLKPVYFEFWQGLVSRLHDRIVYQPEADGWVKSRISP
ncbi:MAG: pyridoxamine 5'-phosphate oxidase, partial [Gammaproteobacteria bacterium]|nr:pyridoxamine 5'-phosphate oxidase [Gammaproteobacteria bacterium]